MTSMTATPDATALARQLYSLRQNRSQVPTGQLVSVPVALQDAIDAQSQLSKLEGAGFNAWKVAKSPGGDPVVAPLYPYVDNLAPAALSWRRSMKIEVEIAVELQRDFPVRTDRTYERTEIEAAISNAYLGAEVVWSGISEGGTISFLASLADRLGNMGYVRGPALPLAVLQPGLNIPLKLRFNGQVAFDAAGHHPTKDPLTWLCDYANNPSRLATVLTAGSIITTGSLCGAIEVPGPGDIAVQFGNKASMHFALS
ncbi:2-keto-4-pentenoate hydratase [Rhizobium sp. CFBP 8762]|uniref:2-keto-4-pentenoate hydratase n=1 Tax=Rhizobium sp. CFBP 8762 TaxID=2775279 RepID=UPI00177C9E1B|nr:2-keto-4-pentenoate hydratase [Rhizobium sp. CFBP 8762]MBD8555055.1 2-keto-4-pentenoate hydratase [Rhizobium sp. CFBP 8762]